MTVPPLYQLDTNILVHFVRADGVRGRVRAGHPLLALDPKPVLSIVTAGEMRSLALQYRWGMRSWSRRSSSSATSTWCPGRLAGAGRGLRRHRPPPPGPGARSGQERPVDRGHRPRPRGHPAHHRPGLRPARPGVHRPGLDRPEHRRRGAVAATDSPSVRRHRVVGGPSPVTDCPVVPGRKPSGCTRHFGLTARSRWSPSRDSSS